MAHLNSLGSDYIKNELGYYTDSSADEGYDTLSPISQKKTSTVRDGELYETPKSTPFTARKTPTTSNSFSQDSPTRNIRRNKSSQKRPAYGWSQNKLAPSMLEHESAPESVSLFEKNISSSPAEEDSAWSSDDSPSPLRTPVGLRSLTPKRPGSSRSYSQHKKNASSNFALPTPFGRSPSEWFIDSDLANSTKDLKAEIKVENGNQEDDASEGEARHILFYLLLSILFVIVSFTLYTILFSNSEEQEAKSL